MQIKKMLQEDDAVSPVIGVILMVAITVILAAVIASFVLGLGGSQQQTPQASFSWDYTSKSLSDVGSAADGIAELSHDGGDTIPASELYVRGDGLAKESTSGGTPDRDDQITKNDQQWPKGNATASMGDQSAVTGGNTVGVIVSSKFELSLVWEPAEGDTSATLSEKTGPDA